MSAVDDVDQLIEQWQLAAGEFVKGNPEPVKKLWSHKEDVTLANPWGPPVRGFDEVAKTIEHAASLRRDGEFLGSEIVAKYGSREDIAPIATRSTMIFRPEEGTWKMVHRHADPITTPQPTESVIQE